MASRGVDSNRAVLQLGDNGFHSHVDAASDGNRVATGGDIAKAFVHNSLGQNGGGGGAVTGDVVGLARDFADKLRAHVLVWVFQLNFLGDGDAVLGNCRGAPLLVEDDVSSARAEGDFHRVSDGIRAALKGTPGVLIKQ